jgi:hypothetical protein
MAFPTTTTYTGVLSVFEIDDAKYDEWVVAHANGTDQQLIIQLVEQGQAVLVREIN